MAERLKDMFFTQESMDIFAATIHRFYPGFDKARFLELVFDENFTAKELKERSKVRLEYAVFFVKANGRLSKKVFKITEGNYKPGTHSFVRKHSFVDMSTRKHYPGTHHISLIINGEEAAKASCEVKK